MFRRASAAEQGREWADFKIRRWRHFLLDERILQRCVRVSGMQPSCVAKTAVQERGLPYGEQASFRVWLVLPYKPELQGLSRNLRATVEAWNGHLLESLGFRFDVQVAWSKAGK